MIVALDGYTKHQPATILRRWLATLSSTLNKQIEGIMTVGIMRWARQTTGGLPSVFWYLWVGTLINRMGIFVVPFLALYLTEKQNMSIESASMIVSLYGLGSFTAQVAGGFFADTYGRRPTMLISLFVTPLMLLMMGTFSGFWAIALLTLMTGFFTDLYRPASSALIADTVSPVDRARAFSLRFWAINLGAAIGLSMGGWLASQNYLYLFIGDAITTFSYGIVILFFVPETRPVHTPRKNTGSAWTNLKASFAGERQLLIFTLCFGLLILTSASVYRQDGITLPLAMIENGFSKADYGRVIALNGIIIVLLSLTLNQVFARYAYLNLMASSALLIGVGFGLYTFAATVPMYAMGVMLWTIGEIIGAPIAPSILADLAPLHRRGFYQGVIGSANGLAAFAGPMIGGLVYSKLGEKPLWIGCLLVEIGVAVGYWLLHPMYQRLKNRM